MLSRRVIDFPGSVHFVTFSTFQRRQFLGPAACKDIVLESLEKCRIVHHAKCAGFVVMPDHVHAILSGENSFRISAFVQVWKKTSSYRIRRFFEQELERYLQLCPAGTPIWQARFYDFNVESDRKLNEKLDYMHENPVAARLVATSRDWSWSSVHHYEGGRPTGVTVSYGY